MVVIVWDTSSCAFLQDCCSLQSFVIFKPILANFCISYMDLDLKSIIILGFVWSLNPLLDDIGGINCVSNLTLSCMYLQFSQY